MRLLFDVFSEQGHQRVAVDTHQMDRYQRELWEALPSDIRRTCVEHLVETFPAFMLRTIANTMEEHGSDWTTRLYDEERERGVPISFHFADGMAFRNALREVVPDIDLPTVMGWDDYYVPAVEDAALLHAEREARVEPSVPSLAGAVWGLASTVASLAWTALRPRRT